MKISEETKQKMAGHLMDRADDLADYFDSQGINAVEALSTCGYFCVAVMMEMPADVFTSFIATMEQAYKGQLKS